MFVQNGRIGSGGAPRWSDIPHDDLQSPWADSSLDSGASGSKGPAQRQGLPLTHIGGEQQQAGGFGQAGRRLNAGEKVYQSGWSDASGGSISDASGSSSILRVASEAGSSRSFLTYADGSWGSLSGTQRTLAGDGAAGRPPQSRGDQGVDVNSDGDAEPQCYNLEQHNEGSCRPCIYLQKKSGCSRGDACTFCHLPHADKRARPSKAKRDRCKSALEASRALASS